MMPTLDRRWLPVLLASVAVAGGRAPGDDPVPLPAVPPVPTLPAPTPTADPPAVLPEIAPQPAAAPPAPVPAAPAPAEVPAARPEVPPPVPGPPPATAPVAGLTVEGVPLVQNLNAGWFNGPVGGGCSSCGGTDPGCGGCGGNTACVPGHKSCQRYPDRSTIFSRFAGAIYDGVCCPDPCYAPKWTTLANASFFADSGRPVTHTRLRWVNGYQMTSADRGEFFMARADGQGLGPSPRAPWKGPNVVDWNELSMYTEAAVGGKFAVINSMPYRSLESPTSNVGSGFADIMFGTKSLLADTELFQLTFLFKTYIPTGNVRSGDGTGHVSLEPSIVLGVQVSCDSFLQVQFGDSIPIGGDPSYSGNVLLYHVSYNTVIMRPAPDVQLIATWEANGYSFLGGSWSSIVQGQVKGNDYTYISAGPGIRMSFCDKLDFGVGTAFSLTEYNLARRIAQFEFRYRY